MKIYLASKWQNRERLRPIAAAIKMLGHEITSSWVWKDDPDGLASKAAIRDLREVDAADALILWPNCEVPQPAGHTGGGMFVEFGYALAREKTVFVVEPQASTCIFIQLPGLIAVEDWPAALELLGKGHLWDSPASRLV